MSDTAIMTSTGKPRSVAKHAAVLLDRSRSLAEAVAKLRSLLDPANGCGWSHLTPETSLYPMRSKLESVMARVREEALIDTDSAAWLTWAEALFLELVTRSDERCPQPGAGQWSGASGPAIRSQTTVLAARILADNPPPTVVVPPKELTTAQMVAQAKRVAAVVKSAEARQRILDAVAAVEA